MDTKLALRKLEVEARDIYASLSAEQSSCYDTVKSAILPAYELVLEAYRQHFRDYRKFNKQSFVEFARQKEHLFFFSNMFIEQTTKSNSQNITSLQAIGLFICFFLNQKQTF